MATYTYECNNPHCKEQFDRFGKKISERDNPEECPTCGTRSHRILTAGQLIIIN